MSYSIPFGIVYKYAYNRIAGFELGVPFTGINQLDHSIVNKENVREFITGELSEADSEDIRREIESFRKTYTFGALQSNEWYIFSGFSLSYTFGRPSRYCD